MAVENSRENTSIHTFSKKLASKKFFLSKKTYEAVNENEAVFHLWARALFRRPPRSAAVPHAFRGSSRHLLPTRYQQI